MYNKKRNTTITAMANNNNNKKIKYNDITHCCKCERRKEQLVFK